MAQKAITQQQSKPVRRYKVGKHLKNQHETVPSDKVSGWLVSRNTVASLATPSERTLSSSPSVSSAGGASPSKSAFRVRRDIETLNGREQIHAGTPSAKIFPYLDLGCQGSWANAAAVEPRRHPLSDAGTRYLPVLLFSGWRFRLAGLVSVVWGMLLCIGVCFTASGPLE